MPEVGRPAMFETAQELEAKINEYFQTGLKKRKILIGKAPNQQLIEIECPTITGLAIFLGFESRQSFYDYENREAFSYTVKRARLFIENEYEEQLTSGNTVGAIFALKNMGWKDKVETENTNTNLNSEPLTPEKVQELKQAFHTDY